MPNPRPGHHTTGKCASRQKLRATIYHKRTKGKDWTKIGRETGTSARTAKRLHGEEEAIRRAARDLAYEQDMLVKESHLHRPRHKTIPASGRWKDVAALILFGMAMVVVFALLHFIG